MLYPLRFAPVYFEKVWGGRRLETIMGRNIPQASPIGESWEVSDHPHGRSVIANGPLSGQLLHKVIEASPESLLGYRVRERYDDSFPLLMKYLDANDKLSVQVHPDDAYAFMHEGERGKTEMWYVLHADPEAVLIAGLQQGVTVEQFRQALAEGDPSALLYYLPVKTGDTIFIPSGRIHALLSGLLILEIQQNSDTTYRLYDWGRLGLDGKLRQLHVEQALAVTNWIDYTPTTQIGHVELEGVNRKTTLITCAYFVVEKFDLGSERIFHGDGGSFHVLNCVAGEGALNWAGGAESLAYGDSLLLPASLTDFAIQPNGDASFLLTYVP